MDITQKTPTLDSLTIKDHNYDSKIEALNILAILKVKDYLEIANTIKNNNELQRKRVGNPSTVYALLKEDLKNGCLIPSIVLALDDQSEAVFDIHEPDYKKVKENISERSESIKILDGLQRTNTLIDLSNDLKNKEGKDAEQITNDLAILNDLHERNIRVEVYLNVSRFGILYRMLTLNTGQTPMSLRHQIEILYSDYYIKEKDGIVLTRDASESRPPKLGQYKFSDVVEGVTSFIDGSEFSLDRFDLLNYIKTLKKLSSEKNTGDIFDSFTITYHKLLTELVKKSNNWELNYETLTEENLSFFPVQKVDDNGKETRLSPFGRTAQDIFLKAQIFTGLGAALSFLKQKDVISDIVNLHGFITEIKFATSSKEAFDTLVVRLEQIRKESKKIGESQRTFFKFFFISLFNENDQDSYLIFENAVDSAYRKTV
ncbi:hypothetical protein [Mucilaginibacter kameinonensis]|uniref:hypothetical protein n=1 Tax=Mucilaginibacter kameinonensis TaxID=452286 RepID=UPI000EF7ED16|nr:hypothetical protein [Mucilaginibacter kameinonensis]